jgi:hypothetical protein
MRLESCRLQPGCREFKDKGASFISNSGLPADCCCSPKKSLSGRDAKTFC